MSFELAREESLAENAARLAHTRLDRSLGALASIDEAPPTAEAVHESRRDLKKLRALLRLARESLGDEVYRRENAAYRDAGRVLSAVRDAGVLLHTFDKLRGDLAGLLPTGTLERMEHGLTHALHAAARTLDPGKRLPEVVAALTAARERTEHWPLPGEAKDSWPALDGSLVKTYRRGRRAMRCAAKLPAEGDFHEWRKQVKHLGYQLRLLRPLLGHRFKRKGKRLAALGDLLGNEHDLAVLALTLTRNHPEALPAVGIVVRHIDAHRRALQHAALKLGQRIYRRKGRRFEKRLRLRWKPWHANGQAR